MAKKWEIGDTLIVVRTNATDQEWVGIGKVTIPFKIGQEVKIRNFIERGIHVVGEKYTFPKEIFKLKEIDLVEEANRRYPLGTVYNNGNVLDRKMTSYSIDSTSRINSAGAGSEVSVTSSYGTYTLYRNGIWANVIEEAKDSGTASFSDDDILEKAKKDYPIGTEFYCAIEGQKIKSIVKGELKWFGSERKHIDCLGSRFVYSQGKWAEIISTASKNEAVEIVSLKGRWLKCLKETNWANIYNRPEPGQYVEIIQGNHGDHLEVYTMDRKRETMRKGRYLTDKEFELMSVGFDPNNVYIVGYDPYKIEDKKAFIEDVHSVDLELRTKKTTYYKF